MGVNGGIENQSGKRSFSVMVIFGHGHFRSFSKKSLVILSYSKYKYYLYYTIGDHFLPQNKNDRK